MLAPFCFTSLVSLAMVAVVLLLNPIGTEALRMPCISQKSSLISRGIERSSSLKEVRIRASLDGKDYQKESIDYLEKELFRCLGSISPFDRFQIPLLKERLKREEERKEREEKQEKERKEREEKQEKERKEQEEKQEKQRWEREKKLIYYAIEGEYDDVDTDSMYITRDIFTIWVADNKILYNAESMTTVRLFEELEEGGIYKLTKKTFRFEL